MSGDARPVATGTVLPVALTMDQVAAALNVSVPTAYQLTNEGLLRTFTIGRRRFASLEAIQACVGALEERGGALPAESGANNRARRGRAAPREVS